MTHTCPVCGYNELPHPPEKWMICPCCLTKFGYSDENWGIETLRGDWIASGAEWGSRVIPQPLNYDPESQLRNIGYELTDADRKMVSLTEQAIADNFVFLKSEVSVTVPKGISKPTVQVDMVRFRTIGTLKYEVLPTPRQKETFIMVPA